MAATEQFHLALTTAGSDEQAETLALEDIQLQMTNAGGSNSSPHEGATLERERITANEVR